MTVERVNMDEDEARLIERLLRTINNQAIREEILRLWGEPGLMLAWDIDDERFVLTLERGA